MELKNIPFEVKEADNLVEYLTLNALIVLKLYYEIYNGYEVDKMAHWSFTGIYIN